MYTLLKLSMSFLWLIYFIIIIVLEKIGILNIFYQIDDLDKSNDL